MFRDVAIGQMDIREERFRLFIDAPPDETHLSCITKTAALALYLVFLVCSMNESMARLTERDEIIRAITTHLSRLDMMDIQDEIFGLAMTPLAGMIIPSQDVLTNIPETELRSLLILFPLYFRMAYLLNVKLCTFKSGSADGQELMHHLDRFEMSLNFVLHRRR